MWDMLRLGIRDLWANRKAVCMYAVFAYMLTLGALMMLDELISEWRWGVGETHTYELVPVGGGEPLDLSEVGKAIDATLQDNGTAFFYDSALNNRFGGTVRVILATDLSTGERKVWWIFPRREGAIEDLLDVMGSGEEVSLSSLRGTTARALKPEHHIFPEDRLFAIDAPQWKQLSAYLRSSIELREIIGGLTVKGAAAAQRADDRLRRVLENGPWQLGVYSSTNADDVYFLTRYLLVMDLLLFGVFGMVYVLFIGKIARKLRRSYAMHRVYGATTLHFLVRHSVFALFACGVCFTGIQYLNRFRADQVMRLSALWTMGMLAVLTAVNVWVLLRESKRNLCQGE